MMRIVSRSGKVEATTFIVYSRQIRVPGELVHVVNNDGDILAKGQVTRKMADMTKFQKRTVYGHGFTNTGTGYYEVKLY